MKKCLALLAVAVVLLSQSSCLVLKKKYDEQVALADKMKAERDDCNDKLNQANATIDDLNKQIANLNSEIDKLKDSNASLEDKLKKTKDLKDQSDAICERVKQQLDALTNSSAAEKDKLLKDLAQKEKELMAKAEELNKISAQLNERDAKVRELESLIARKDSAVQALKEKMLAALKGFNAGDLSVYEKDGKVYVALSDKLLFKTGSYTVEERGKDALKKIAEVLSKQSDINVAIEGHTDSIPYVSSTSGPINSNWDLSVMRASSVTKIMVDDYKVDATRITPMGRSRYFPVETNATAEGRSRNRRIEVVLEPDMRAIFSILNSSN
ncbi:MAG: OmpA family protein [Chitinophagales bacterium]